MRLLTATTKTQGHRPDDFAWTIEGELVWPGLVCATDARDPHGGCGCGRAFSGLNSHRGTTTAEVRDLPLTVDDLWLAMQAHLYDSGFLLPEATAKPFAGPDTPSRRRRRQPRGSSRCTQHGPGSVDDEITEEARLVIALGHAFPVGSIVERRLDEFAVRVLQH
jgi:hypothetical protein